MLRFRLLCCVAAVTFALLGAGRQSRPAAPVATPTPSPAPILSDPVIVIYPLTVNGDIPRDAGARIAELFSDQIKSLGGVKVLPVSTNAARAKYLTEAQKAGADYYVAGYVTPIGDEVSLVEQIVSTGSGTVVWSNTARIQTFADAGAQASTMRQAILSHAGRVVAAYSQPAPAETSTPSAGSGSFLNNLLRRKKKPVAAATPRPVASPPGTAVALVRPRVALAQVQGGAPASDRDFATSTLRTALSISSETRLLGANARLPQDVGTACSGNTTDVALSGNLNLVRVARLFGATVRADFELLAYECGKHNQIYRKTFSAQASGRDANQTAISTATADAVRDYFQKPRT